MHGVSQGVREWRPSYWHRTQTRRPFFLLRPCVMTEDPEETEAPPAEEPAVPVEEREDIEVQAMKDRFVKLIRWVAGCAGFHPAPAGSRARTALAAGPHIVPLLSLCAGRSRRCLS